MAISIEKNGFVFYDIMAKSTENPEAKQIFQILANMERGHIEVFNKLLDETDNSPPVSLDEEYNHYFQTLVDNAVFTDEAINSEMVATTNSDLAALELGINAEKDSLLFYYEMKNVVPPPVTAAINKIITEEKLHLQQLSELKKRLGGD
jgi:rubrerythrin